MAIVAKPLVSIIVPTYNRACLLPKALQSILAQTYKEVQIIVVDDGSTDNTQEVASRFSMIEYIRVAHAGQANARNVGLMHARGSVIASLDSDDVWMPEFLDRCVDKLMVGQLDFVFANWKQVDKAGNSFDFLSGDPYIRPFIKESRNHGWIDLSSDELRSLYLVSCPSPSSSVVIRRSSISDGWDQCIRIGEDWSLYLDMILGKPCRAAFTLEALWSKHVHDSNIYDGRIRKEVLEILVEDERRIIDRYQSNLKSSELKRMQRRYVAILMELSKHRLLREKNIKDFWRLFNKSTTISLWYALDQIPKLVATAVRNRRHRAGDTGSES